MADTLLILNHMRIRFYAIFYALIFLSWLAKANSCLDSYSYLNKYTRQLNFEMEQKYQSLKFLIENPDGFIKIIEDRFKQQKITNPKDPYGFDYSEIGIPLIKDIRADLMSWKRELYLDANTNYLNPFRRKNLLTIIKFTEELLFEANFYLEANSVSYRNLIEFSYFYTRIRGILDIEKHTIFEKIYLFIDRRINGNAQYAVEKELELYRKRQFRVFQKMSFSSGFSKSSKVFKDIFSNLDELTTIWVPTNAALERDIFLRLMNKKINIIGVTAEPILADGVKRPPGDFWNHDVRHESGKLYESGQYIEKNAVSPQKFEKVSKLSDKWLVELNKEIDRVQNQDLKEAIKLQIFNFHHDRGYPLIPSVYLNYRYDNITLFLYFFQKSSGEGVSFKEPVKNLKAADKWLREFWDKRLIEETSIY